jgi:hypothetical protein
MPEKKKAPENPYVEIIDVSPAQAMQWLSAVPDYQRKKDERQIHKLIIAIQRNEWRVNGATIVFNDKGELIDGQHRLEAISRASKTVQCLVVTGVRSDELTFASLGDVKSRKIADFLHCKNANVVAAVLRLIWYLENKILDTSTTRNSPQSSPPVAEIVKLAKKYADEIQVTIEPLTETMRVTRSGAWVPFLMYYFTTYRPRTEATKVAEFFMRVADGVNLEAHSPMLLLRKRLIEQSPGVAILPRRVREALVLKALNYFLDGKQIERLVWYPDKEPFPPLRGYDRDAVEKPGKPSGKKEEDANAKE